MAGGTAHRSVVERLTGALADATGRPEEEVRLAVTAAAVAGALVAVLRVVDHLAGLGSDVHAPRHRHPATAEQAGAV